VNVTFTDGDTASIKANEGLYIGGGASLLNDAKSLELELTANWKYQAIEAKNGSIHWTRYPIDALMFYRTEHVRVGGGLTYHVSPKYSSSGAAGDANVKLKNSLGEVLQVEYRWGESGGVGIRYTNLEYGLDDGPKIRSNGLGIEVTGRF
jgi:hypothetical protein